MGGGAESCGGSAAAVPLHPQAGRNNGASEDAAPTGIYPCEAAGRHLAVAALCRNVRGRRLLWYSSLWRLF